MHRTGRQRARWTFRSREHKEEAEREEGTTSISSLSLENLKARSRPVHATPQQKPCDVPVNTQRLVYRLKHQPTGDTSDPNLHVAHVHERLWRSSLHVTCPQGVKH